MQRKFRFLRIILALLFLSGCSPGIQQIAWTPAAAPLLPSPSPVPTQTPSPSPEPSPTTLPTPAAAPSPCLCSPLQNVALDQLPGLISNPYHPPRPGYDDPHSGIDLAIRLPGSLVAVSGNPVQAALAGQVAMLVVDRFPFGNAVVIETPLDTFSSAWWAAAEIPTVSPTLAPVSALTCPTEPVIDIPASEQRSLYVLYAHLLDPPDLQPGESIACGQVLGTVGQSGNALNPHLHFEARAGPAGLRLPAMSHYDASASLEEMSSYCLWSVSGLFQLVDPQKVLQLEP